jgi:hypothetical protein
VAELSRTTNGTGERSLRGFVGCAAGTVSYLPRARVAAESWRRYHPDSPFFVLLIDGDDWPAESEPFEIVLPKELGLSREELAVQLGIYDAYEVACALKPPLFRLLLDWGASAVIFTDSDACFYAGVSDLADAAARAGVALIPHATGHALQRRYFPLSQIEYRQITNGLFNTGLIAVGPGGRQFVDWWGAWLSRDSLKDSVAGMWTDQIWVEWAAAYFEHVVVRDTSLNVGFWNLDERELGGTETEPTVDGAPLRHFHFAGYDPRRPELYSTYYEDVRFVGRDWPQPPANPILSELLRRYSEWLMESESEELRERPYCYGVSAGGRELGHRERSIYREAVLAAEFQGLEQPPNPFDRSRIDEFERLVSDPASNKSLSPQARKRIERVRQPGVTFSSLSRIGKRLTPAIRYALAETPPASLEVRGRVASDTVRQEYQGKDGLPTTE